jgi:phage gp45-like
MWLSSQMRPAPATADADLGVTTIAGGSAGVVTRGEVRSLPVFSPGGYLWLPASGSTVLVIRGGPGGEESCVCGTQQTAAPRGMLPGEVFLFSAGGASVYLRNDGSIELTGAVSVTGSLRVNGIACNAGITT